MSSPLISGGPILNQHKILHTLFSVGIEGSELVNFVKLVKLTKFAKLIKFTKLVTFSKLVKFAKLVKFVTTNKQQTIMIY